ncbi:DUF2147 domain-containing protein [Spirosoma arcticum]
MKHVLFLLSLGLLAVTPLQAQQSDQILGIWEMDDKDNKLEITKTGNSYTGVLLWGKQITEADGKTFKKDVKNPDAGLRQRSLEKTVFISGLTFSDGQWENGKLYDATSGKTYKCNVKMEKGQLLLRGYLGVPMLGKTVTYNKLK